MSDWMNERRLVQNMQIPEANVTKNAIKQVNKQRVQPTILLYME